MVEYRCCLESKGRCFEGNKRKDVELVIDTLIGSKGKVALFTALELVDFARELRARGFAFRADHAERTREPC